MLESGNAQETRAAVQAALPRLASVLASTSETFLQISLESAGVGPVHDGLRQQVVDVNHGQGRSADEVRRPNADWIPKLAVVPQAWHSQASWEVRSIFQSEKFTEVARALSKHRAVNNPEHCNIAARRQRSQIEID